MARWSPWSAALALAALPALVLAKDQGTAASAQYFVKNLPGLPKDAPPIPMHAGHIEVTPEHNGNLFFWHFQNKHLADRPRTVIWLNGGPGCSSEDGALMEIGPYRVQEDKTLKMNEGSWHEFANLLFVDNPVGTGFSYVDTDSYIHELDTMADQFVKFLEKFFEMFPQYAGDDLYLAGESYAGQHIPYIARAILDRNNGDFVEQKWNLGGLLIGNGWISPYEQYDAYLDFARERGLIERGSDTDTQLGLLLRICKKKLASDHGHVDYGDCEEILSQLLKLTSTGGGDDACINMYDVRLKDSYPSCGMSWPPDLDNVTPYLRQKEVTDALHIGSGKNTGWQECSGAVGKNFNTKSSKPSIELFPDLIKEVPVLLFSGAEDLICNHLGTEALIDKLQWNGAMGLGDAPRQNWTFDGKDAGFWQEARNLSYVLFRDSSHMVPFDYPIRTRDMLHRFMRVDDHYSPFDSHLDGQEDSKAALDRQREQQLKEEAKWHAYRKSGEIVLAIVIIAAVAWGWFLWRERKKRQSYLALSGGESVDGRGTRFADVRNRTARDGDIEAAAFDESELDDLHVETPRNAEGQKYDIGSDSEEDEEDVSQGREKGKSSNGSSSR